MVQVEGAVGPMMRSDGSVDTLRMSRFGSLVVTDAHGKYWEAVSRGNVYTAATQAGVALTVGISTTATGIILTNPPNSGVYLSILEFICALTTAPAGIATIGLQAVVTPQIAETTHTTPLTVRNCLIGSTKSGVGKADSSSTLAATPVAVRAVPGGPVATGSVTTAYIKDVVDGALILSPGTAIATFALTTAISALLSITWEEYALLTT